MLFCDLPGSPGPYGHMGLLFHGMPIGTSTSLRLEGGDAQLVHRVTLSPRFEFVAQLTD